MYGMNNIRLPTPDSSMYRMNAAYWYRKSYLIVTHVRVLSAHQAIDGIRKRRPQGPSYVGFEKYPVNKAKWSSRLGIIDDLPWTTIEIYYRR